MQLDRTESSVAENADENIIFQNSLGRNGELDTQ
jgi:hypothetical protein